jgi:hypothetical protein
MLSNARKAIFVFLGSLVTNVATDLMQDGHPFPTNWGDAARWLISIVALTLGTYQIAPAKGVETPPAVAPGTPGRPFG